MSETCHKLIKYLLEVGWRVAVFTDPNVAPVITKSEKQGSRTVVRTAEITHDDVIALVEFGAIVEASRSDEAVLYRLAETNIPQRATPATVAQIEAQVKQVRREAERCSSEESCVDADGAPTEMAVLKRFWIEHHSKEK